MANGAIFLFKCTILSFLPYSNLLFSSFLFAYIGNKPLASYQNMGPLRLVIGMKVEIVWAVVALGLAN